MPRALLDLTGERFGNLTVFSEAPRHRRPDGKTRRMLNVVCDCGRERVVMIDNLTTGRSKSCGQCDMRYRTPTEGRVHWPAHEAIAALGQALDALPLYRTEEWRMLRRSLIKVLRYHDGMRRTGPYARDKDRP